MGNYSKPALRRVLATYSSKKQGAEAGQRGAVLFRLLPLNRSCWEHCTAILGARGQILLLPFDHSKRVTGPIALQPFQQTWHHIPQDCRFSEYCNNALLLLFNKGCMQ